jgi:hypothetical protein
MRSLEDLIDYQESREEIPYWHVGNGENMRSKVSSYQRGYLMEKEDQKCLLVIRGIEIFLPLSLVEVRSCIVEETILEGQLVVTIKEKEELGQTSELDLVEEEENSTKMLKIFSQEAEQGITTTLEVVAEEEHADKILTPWEMELEMLEDWLNHPEPVDDCHEQKVMQMLAEEHSKELLRILS